ncbi:hypothetical protein PVK06_001932 [Gossypium arboreum]|uniref:Uncharacterized protein n=1 Tax=Gossypium arboreum TaxID=29729 RepID=A0ABR0R3N7_GOSAR|nr:hypothetical protein PVK06_001932 [Gossypium arboreum]
MDHLGNLIQNIERSLVPLETKSTSLEPLLHSDTYGEGTVDHEAMEVAKTVLEVTNVTWTAMECCHYRHTPNDNSPENHDYFKLEIELETLKSENQQS